MPIIASFTFRTISFEVWEEVVGPAAHPIATIHASPGFFVLGGGAIADYGAGAGSLLTAIYPPTDTEWEARAKDHELSSPATLRAYCFTAQVPLGAYARVDATSPTAVNHPNATAALPPGYVLVGGGARANFDEGAPGSLLYASRPEGAASWYAASKDHRVVSPATVTAYAIGLQRTFLDSLGLIVVRISSTAEAPTAHPQASCFISTGQAQLVAGGAETHWSGSGNLLTATAPIDAAGTPLPQGNVWASYGKDHIDPDPSTITSWGLALVSCSRD